MITHSFKKSLLAIFILCVAGGIFFIVIATYQKEDLFVTEQEPDTVQNDGDAVKEQDSFVGPHDPFDYALAYINEEYHQVRLDYLITPNKDKKTVLEKIQELTGQLGVFIKEDVTLLPGLSATVGASGDLYQIQLPSGIFSVADVLEDVLGEGTRVGWVYKRPDREFAPRVGYKARLYDTRGASFFVIQKYDGDIPSVIYTEKELPDFVTNYLENNQTENNPGVLFLDMQHNVFFVGERESDNLTIYQIDGQDIKNIFSQVYGPWGEFRFLESPDRKKVAVSFWKEGDRSVLTGHTLDNQSIIFDLEHHTVISVPTPNDALFPTFWINNNELTYGSAAGKDCGYYPHIGHFDIVKNKFEIANSSGGTYAYTKYLDSFVDYDDTGYRTFVVADGSQYSSDGMCAGMVSNKIIGLSESGEEEELYEAPDGHYLSPIGFIDEDNLLFLVYPVLEVSTNGQTSVPAFIKKTGVPTAHLLNEKTKQVKQITRMEIQGLLNEIKGKTPLIKENVSIVLDGSVLDLNYTTDTLRLSGTVFDVTTQSSGQVSNRLPYEGMYFLLGKTDDRFAHLSRALEVLAE